MRTVSVFLKSGITLTFKDNEKFEEYNGFNGFEEITFDDVVEQIRNLVFGYGNLYIKQHLTHDEKEITHTICLPETQIQWFMVEEVSE